MAEYTTIPLSIIIETFIKELLNNDWEVSAIDVVKDKVVLRRTD